MNKRNWALAAGGIIVSALILIMLFPDKFTSLNPYVIEGIKSAAQNNGDMAVKGAPFAPSKINIFGTDQLGRDIYSLIIYGTRLTLEMGILIVIGRFLIALPIGMASGFGSSICKSAINLFNILFSAVPALIISILILKVSFFKGLYKEQSVMAFTVVLTVTGFGKLAGLISERTENILSRPFIRGERAIGKKNINIAFQNVLSHLAPELIVLIFMEMALVLSFIMELGFFGVFVGNLRVVTETDSAVMKIINISYEPEWASLLASSIFYIKSAPWMVITPAVTFFISILGFNLIGEGLREKLQGRNSKLIYKSALKKKYKKLFYPVSLLLIIFISFQALNYYRNQAENNAAQSISDWEYKDNVILGTNEAEYTAERLKYSLQEAGFKPIGKDYIQAYNIDSLKKIDSYEFNIINSAEKHKLILGKDFSLSANNDYDISGEVYDGRENNILNLKSMEVLKNKFVLLDENIYSQEELNKVYERIKVSEALGIVNIIQGDKKLPDMINKGKGEKAFIYLTKETSKYIKTGSRISIKIKSSSLSSEGRNVIGILSGNNKNLAKEAIMISIGYNYLNWEKENTEEKIKIVLETAKKLYDKRDKQGRSIIIAFFDGNLADNYAGVRNYTENPLYPLENTVINIDLTGMNIKADSLVLNSQQVPVTRYSAWAFCHEFEKKVEDSGIDIIKYSSKKTVSEILAEGPDYQEILYYKGAVPSIITVQKTDSGGKKTELEKYFEDALVSSITNINY